MIGAYLTQILLQNTELEAIIEGRIKPIHGTELDVFPAVRYVEDVFDPDLCADGGVWNYSIKFLIFGNTYSETKIIQDLIYQELERFVDSIILFCYQSSSLDIAESVSDINGFSIYSTEQNFKVLTQK